MVGGRRVGVADGGMRRWMVGVGKIEAVGRGMENGGKWVEAGGR